MNQASLCLTWRHAPATQLCALGLLSMTFTLEPEVFGGIVSLGVPLIVAGIFLAIPELPRVSAKYSGYILPAMAYLGSIVLSLCYLSTDLTAPAVRVLTQILGFLLYLFIQRTLEKDAPDGDVAKMWTDTLAWAGCILAIHYLGNIAALGQGGMLAEALRQRYTGGLMSLAWGASNTIASALLMPLCASLLALTAFGQRSKLMWLPPIAIMACIVATMSRGALGSLLLGGILYAAIGRNVRVVFVAIVGAVVVFGAVVWFVGAENATTCFELRNAHDEDLTQFNGRADFWQEAWTIIVAEFPNPIGYYGSLDRLGHSPHNLVLVNLLEIGAWGTGAFLWLCFAHAGGLWTRRAKLRTQRSRTIVPDIVLCTFAVILLHLMIEDAQYTQPYIIYFWTFLAIASHHATSARSCRKSVPALDAPRLMSPRAII